MIPKKMGDLMKQAQKVQQQMIKLQEKLNAREISAQAGGNMVEAIVNGKGEILKLHLEKEIVNPDDIEMLTDLIIAAVSEAQHRAQEMVQNEMGKLTTGGLNIPNIF